MSTDIDTFLMDAYPDIVLPVITSNDINPGDLVVVDKTNYTAKAAASATVTGIFVGVAMQKTPFSVYGEDGDLPGILVRRAGIFMFDTVDSLVYKPFEPVKYVTNAHTVTNASVTPSTQQVGVVLLRPPTTPRASEATPVPESITGGTGVKVPVLITPHWPSIL